MTIIVHHLENSRSQRILWLLEELGLDYEIRFYKRDPKTMMAPPGLKQVHPLGKSPLIEHGGRVIAETGAIVEYIVALADGRFGPPGQIDAALRWRHFLHYAEGSMMPPLFALLVISKLGILGKPAKGIIERMLTAHLDWLDTELASRPWFAGDDLTAADVMMSFPLEASRERIDMGERWPRISDWLERIHARPAYARALKAGGPYAYA